MDDDSNNSNDNNITITAKESDDKSQIRSMGKLGSNFHKQDLIFSKIVI